MNHLLTMMKKQIQDTNLKRIVFPEYHDERILKAANRLAIERLIKPIFIGRKEEVDKQASQAGISLQHYGVICPQSYQASDKLVNLLLQRRGGRLTLEKAQELLKDPYYFSAMLVYAGEADGLVSGASVTTSKAARPVLEIMQAKAGMKKVSAAYLLVREDEHYLFADCAIQIEPTSEDLVEITLQSAETAKNFQLQPKIAMLSFSTKGSAQSTETEKIVAALKRVKSLAPDLSIDGEVQFDAAYMPALAAKKEAKLTIDGAANVFIFPNLAAGNISCKIAERLGNFQAIGPLIQGLNQPVNLLSRTCSEEDVYSVTLYTAMQASILTEQRRNLS